MFQMQDCDAKPTWKAAAATLLPTGCIAVKACSKQSRRRTNAAVENGSVDEPKATAVKDQPTKRSFDETIEKLLLHRSLSVESESRRPSTVKQCSSGSLNCGTDEDDRGAANGATDRPQPAAAAPIPKVARLHHYNAPVHLDVGGKIYTTTMETLTKQSHSHLAKLFNGHTPIVLDYLKQNYFIDRDGKVFRHVLNYLRTGQLLLPSDFKDTSLLMREAEFYGLQEMITLINEYAKTKTATTQ